MTAEQDHFATVTIGECLHQGVERLNKAGINGARLDARLLLAEAIEKDPSYLFGYPEKEVTKAERASFENMITRRTNREPVSRIVGYREFWSIKFYISSETLDPRPDSETLVEATLGLLEDKTIPLRILDLGTGSGCLLLALLSELPKSTGLGVDISAGAVAVAESNALSLGLTERASFQTGNWCEGLSGEWDIIISNPPYIGRHEISDLEPEVLEYDPAKALFAEENGLKDYRDLIPQAAKILKEQGFLVIEAGQGQSLEINDLMVSAELTCLPTIKDLAGIDRACFARKVI
ncbi:peptide chain release factor N(5)-glutamine methyltransferase [Kiloniella antarctica]|uniref:Release factor glutamine methyltransferase n=1 Tax=Kiloniella antarctica TaxID=1550907 RepID=A0ABW5BPP4_9PROT